MAVVDKRIQRHIRSEAQVETTWATVCGISADGLYASAYLYGETEYPSNGFRIPRSLSVSVGDSVKVAWDPRGYRWIEDVAISTPYKKIEIDPNTGTIKTGDGTARPSLLIADSSGVVVGVHNHDADYADIAHDHDADYADQSHGATHLHDGSDPISAIRGSGTSFPAQPAYGDNRPFWRTDRGMEYYYDGTRWLSTQMFSRVDSAPTIQWLASGGQQAPISWPTTFRGGVDAHLIAWTAVFFVNGTNDASNNWTIQLYSDTSFTLISSFATTSFGSGAWNRHEIGVNYLLGTVDTHITIRIQPTGSPGNLLINAGYDYRKVG